MSRIPHILEFAKRHDLGNLIYFCVVDTIFSIRYMIVCLFIRLHFQNEAFFSIIITSITLPERVLQYITQDCLNKMPNQYFSHAGVD